MLHVQVVNRATARQTMREAARVRVIVIGAGVVGASLAYHLTEAGHRVVVFEAGRVGGASTARAAGVLSEVRWDEQDSLWARESRELYLHPPGEAAPCFRQTGSLTVAGAQDRHQLERYGPLLDRLEVPYRVVEGRALVEAFPALRLEEGAWALELPGDGVLTASDYAGHAVRAAARRGAEIHEETPVRLEASGTGLEVVDPQGGRHRADAVVVSAGAWSRRLVAGAGLDLPVRPYRTQLAVVHHPEASRLPSRVLHDMPLGWYWVPEGGNRYLMGDGTEHTESDPDTFRQQADPAFLEGLAERLARRTHGAEGASLGPSWAGVCTATPDRRPLLGPAPGRPDLWVACGMNGFGVMRGPAVGRAVAQWLSGGPAPPERYRAERLAWEPPTFPIREGYELWEVASAG